MEYFQVLDYCILSCLFTSFVRTPTLFFSYLAQFFQCYVGLHKGRPSSMLVRHLELFYLMWDIWFRISVFSLAVTYKVIADIGVLFLLNFGQGKGNLYTVHLQVWPIKLCCPPRPYASPNEPGAVQVLKLLLALTLWQVPLLFVRTSPKTRVGAIWGIAYHDTDLHVMI